MTTREPGRQEIELGRIARFPGARWSCGACGLAFLLAAAGCQTLVGIEPTTVEDGDASMADAGPARFVLALGSNIADRGIASRIDLDTLAVTEDVLPDRVSTDPTLRVLGGRVYLTNRADFQSVAIIEPATLDVELDLSTGADSNPQDVVVVGDRLYAVALAASGVFAFDLTDPLAPPQIIDLSDLDPDGSPDCNSIFASGSTIFASCGLLDEAFQPQDVGKIAVIDADTSSRQMILDLGTRNPLTTITGTPIDGPFAGDMVLGTVDFSTGEGCIERISRTGVPAVRGCLVDNATLGGYAGRIAYSDGKLWVAVSGSQQGLARIAPDGTIEQRIPFETGDVASCPSGHIVANDTNLDGVRVFDAQGTELTVEPLSIGEPPVFANGLACF